MVDDACLDEEDSDDGSTPMDADRMDTDNLKDSNVGNTEGLAIGSFSTNCPSNAKSSSNSQEESARTLEKRPPPIPALMLLVTKTTRNRDLGRSIT